MKKLLLIFIIAAYVIFLPGYVQADNVKNNADQVNQFDNTEVNKFYNYIDKNKSQYEILEDMDFRTYASDFIKNGKGNISFKSIIKAINTYVFKEIFSSMKLMGILIVIAVICALLNNLEDAFENGNVSNVASFACYALIIIVVSQNFYICSELAKNTINKLSDFISALFPVILSLLAGSGGYTEAAVLDPLIIGFISFTVRIFVDFIIPLAFMSFVLGFVDNLSDDYKVDKLSGLIKQIVIWSQEIIMTIFVGIMTVRGITASTADEVTAKTAKFAVDSFVPVVGKCLSDAISNIAGYSLLLKNAISSVGLIIVIIIVAFPIIKILIAAFLFKLTGAVIEPISSKNIVNCITSAGDSLILVDSCLICVSVMFFIMISIIAAAGRMVI